MSPVVVLALDGTPYTLLKKLAGSGIMPNVKHLLDDADFRQMDSVLPPVSSVAWASFLTGQDPLQHGIMGFIDRDPETLSWYVPRADRLRAPTIWQILSGRGRRIFSMNVPMTFPPSRINGIIIGGFLATDLDSATWPAHLGKILKARGYRIDADVELAQNDLPAFLKSLDSILDKRFEMIGHYLEKGPWDVFMAHIMETDRLHHFTWTHMEEGHPVYAAAFNEFYGKLDRHIGKLLAQIPGNTPFLMLSDHGFTTLRREVQLNNWLHASGYLMFRKEHPETLADMHPGSRAYSLYPGRIYLNLRGREQAGTVEPGVAFEALRNELRVRLTEIRDPGTGLPVIKDVVTPEDLMKRISGQALLTDSQVADLRRRAPDLYAIAHEGFDLKGSLWHHDLFMNTVHNGMHTFDDAFLLLRGGSLTEERFSIRDVTAMIFQLLGEEIPAGISSRHILVDEC